MSDCGFPHFCIETGGTSTACRYHYTLAISERDAALARVKVVEDYDKLRHEVFLKYEARVATDTARIAELEGKKT